MSAACFVIVQEAVARMVAQAQRLRPGVGGEEGCPADPIYTRLRHAVDAAVLADNLGATRQACDRWVTYAFQVRPAPSVTPPVRQSKPRARRRSA